MASLLLICLAFLSGSIPSGVIIGRLRGRDPREAGSGNIGAANVARTAGFLAGAMVAVLDVLKGIIPVLLGLWLGMGQPALALVAVAAVLGHDFSIFLHFQGGKGVATTFGVALVLAPIAALLAIATWVGVLVISRYSSLASLTALAALPLFVGLTHRPALYVVAAFALFALAAAKHWENTLRLMTGRERRMGAQHEADGG